MNRKRKVRILALTILSAFTVAAATTATVAWFKFGTDITFGNQGQVKLQAGAEGAYFAYGEGSSSKPYGISDRIHLYNLAWLQYIGYFDGSDTLQPLQPYFELADSIPSTGLDMTGIVLPPIGTEQYPFIGNFDGNGKTIVNLNISNDDPTQSTSDFGIMKPDSTALSGTDNPEIVGFFGVVGTLPNQTIANYSSSVVSVKNLTLKNLTVTSKTSNTLIGLAAGYVNCDQNKINGVRLSGNATLDLGTTGKSAVANVNTTNVSDYGLVGYSAQTGTSGDFSQKISKYYTSEDPEHSGNDFGAQLDIQKINMHIYDTYLKKVGDSGYNANMKLTNMKASTAMNASFADLKTFRDYKIYFGTRYVNTRYNSDTKYGYYMNPNDFTGYNRASDYPSGYTVNSAPTERAVEYQLLDGGFIPLSLDSTNASYTSSKNNAYITGYTYSGYQGYVKLSSHYTGGIGCSLSKDCNASTVTAVQYNYDYDDERVDILGYDSSSGNFYIIDDGNISASSDRNSVLSSYSTKSLNDFNYNMYTTARSNFGTMMTRTGNKRVHSICFTGNAINSYLTYTPESGGKIYFNNQEKSSLQMPKGCIDFNVKSSGYINFLAANYNYQARSNYRFFSLYKIERNSSGSITSVHKIHRIYENVDSNPSSKYIYQYDGNNGSYSSSEAKSTNPIFNVSTALETDRSLTGVLYYFEIPVDQGEYAIAMAEGANTNSLMGAHLIYLDIGVSNSDLPDTEVTGYTITTESSGLKYPEGVDFEVVGTTGASAITTGGASFCVQLDAGTNCKGTSKFTVTSSNVTITNPSIPSKYSYKGSRWSSTAIADKFTVTNGPSETIPDYVEKIRISHISAPMPSATGGRDEITVIDTFNSAGTSITSTVYKYGNNEYSSPDAGSPLAPVVPTQISSIAPLLTSTVITTVRGQELAITLERDNTGLIATFNAVLPVMPWVDGDVYDVTIDQYPNNLKINCSRVATTYTLTINTDNVFSGSSLTGVYPTS